MSQKSKAELIYNNFIYDSLVETVIFGQNTSVYSPLAIMELGKTNAMRLKFDKLKADNEFYQYTIVHCSHDWKPSNLQKTEYIEGSFMGDIMDFEYSTNTFQQYVQYELIFPTLDMQITKSGNYLLKIYRNFDENDLVLTRRFMVVESVTSITGTARPATNATDRFSKQEVDFEINYENFDLQNPFTNINTVIIQNNSWNNSIQNLKPMFMSNNMLQFNYENENVMVGTNEFRYFDIRSLRSFSTNVVDKYTDSLRNAVLKGEEIKAHLNYIKTIDYNGKRVIQNTDGQDATENGDYVLVHFSLRSDNELNVGDVYVYGELSDWRLQDKFKMTYYPNEKIYYLAVKLKQSYYNYHFVTKDPETGKVTYDFTEGNHSETENDYTVLAYYYDNYYGYDRLIGYTTINTMTDRK
ncbi:MAG: DUF5103 domain-containing protein [Flavobacteriales bacterium]|nr:DUF5103 domain-containing protein [Flavobacteriales bacterium]